jgi:uncharacterized protein YcnI
VHASRLPRNDVSMGRRGLLLVLVLCVSWVQCHIPLSPATDQSGVLDSFFFSVPHGCNGQPTTQLAIVFPNAVTTLTLEVVPDYQISKGLWRDDQGQMH